MKMSTSQILLIAAVCCCSLLTGCARPLQVESTWVDSKARQQTFQNVLIVGLTADYNRRCNFEQMMAGFMRTAETTVVTSCSLMDSTDPLTTDGILPVIQKAGSDSVLVTELVGRSDNIVQGGTSDARGEAYYKPVGYGYGYAYPYAYPYAGGFGMPVTYVELDVEQSAFELETTAIIGSNLFIVADKSVVYSMQVTVNNQRTRADALDLITQGIADRMRKDGLIADD